MMVWIARVARETREQPGWALAHITVEPRVVQGTISRLELGGMRKIDANAMIHAYARHLELPPVELRRRALEPWPQSQTGS